MPSLSLTAPTSANASRAATLLQSTLQQASGAQLPIIVESQLAPGKPVVKGKPGFTQLCLSNAEVQRLLVEELEKQFNRGYQTVLLGQNDGQSSCKCDNCKAIHPNYSERLWIVHRNIAEIMQKKAPGKRFCCFLMARPTTPPKLFLNSPTTPRFF